MTTSKLFLDFRYMYIKVLRTEYSLSDSRKCPLVQCIRIHKMYMHITTGKWGEGGFFELETQRHCGTYTHTVQLEFQGHGRFHEETDKSVKAK